MRMCLTIQILGEKTHRYHTFYFSFRIHFPPKENRNSVAKSLRVQNDSGSIERHQSPYRLPSATCLSVTHSHAEKKNDCKLIHLALKQLYVENNKDLAPFKVKFDIKSLVQRSKECHVT